LTIVAENLIEFGKLSFAGFVIGGVLSDVPGRAAIIFAGIFGSIAPMVAGILVKIYLEDE
jgi:hypothetical protein